MLTSEQNAAVAIILATITLCLSWRFLAKEECPRGLLGGAAGLPAAQVSLSVVRKMNPAIFPGSMILEINGAALVFTFSLSRATGILFGIAPAWRANKASKLFAAFAVKYLCNKQQTPIPLPIRTQARVQFNFSVPIARAPVG